MSERTATVLVIDDNEQVRHMLTRVLIYSSFNIIEARSAEEGLKLIADAMPDIVVCDFRLPGMNGIQFVHRLRAGPTTFDLPVVIISGQHTDAASLALSHHRTDFLAKPFLMSVLVQRLRTSLATAQDSAVSPRRDFGN